MLGSIIGAGASILGGIMGNKSAKQAAAQNWHQQKVVMQNQLQWKAQDAEKAGISKYFAMGAPTQSFAPTNVGGNFDFLGNAGQNLGRAVDAGMSQPASQNALLSSIQLEGAKLDNDIKRTQIASNIATLRQAGSPPGIPSEYGPGGMLPGQGNSVQVDGPKIDIKTRRDVADPKAPSNIPGASPGTAFYRNPQGGLTVFIPPEMAESFEQDRIGGAEWMLRNRVAPFFSPTTAGPSSAGLMPWQEYYFNRQSFDWRERDRAGYGRFNTRR